MQPKTFISQLDDAKIVAAISQAESRTSGEIRVFIESKEIDDPLLEAKRQFTVMRMEKTAERNGVLIYIAPRSQKFAIVGDAGVHAKCGDGFWNSTAEEMRVHFKEKRFTEALLTGIQSLGGVLERHFPRRGDDRNELPNELAGS
jgi:uncharacterized membrane protein